MLSTKVKLLILGGAAAAVVAGSAGYFVITGGPDQLTLSGPGSSPSAAVVSSTSPTPGPTSSPAPSPSPAARSRRTEVRILVVSSEAKVLGITPKRLAADYRDGETLSQLAAQKHLRRASFQDAFARNIDTGLVGAVAHGYLTQQQAGTIESYYRTHLPHWTAGAPHSSIGPKAVKG